MSKLSTISFFEKIHCIKLTKVVEDVLNVLFELFLGSMARIEPAVFHHAPQGLDAVEFGAVRGQEVQRYTTLLKQFEFRLDSLGLVNRRIVQNNHQRFVHSLLQLAQKAYKYRRIGMFPILSGRYLAAAEPSGHDVQAPTTRGINAVLLSTGGPGTAVGMHLSKTGFI